MNIPKRVYYVPIAIAVTIFFFGVRSCWNSGSDTKETEETVSGSSLPTKLYLRMDSEGGKFGVKPEQHMVSVKNGMVVLLCKGTYRNGVVSNVLSEVGTGLLGKVGTPSLKEYTLLTTFNPKTLEGTHMGTQDGRIVCEGRVKLSPHPSGLGYAVVFYNGYGPGAPRHASGTFLTY